MLNIKKVFLISLIFLCFFSSLSYSQEIGDIIKSRINPLEKSRIFLKKCFKYGYKFDKQLLFMRKIENNLKGVGIGEKIFAGDLKLGERIPVFMKDGSVYFVTTNFNGKIIDLPSLPIPKFEFYLFPNEWKRICKTSITLSPKYFKREQILYDVPPFPVYNAIRDNYIEKVGIAVSKKDVKNFEIIENGFETPAKNIEESILSIEKLKYITGKKAEFNGNPRQAPLLSMAAASSMCGDWWKTASSGSEEIVFSHYINPLNNEHEYGINFMDLYGDYLKENKKNNKKFPVESFIKDRILKTSSPSSLEGYGSLLLKKEMEGNASLDKIFDNHCGTYEKIRKKLEKNGVILGGIAPRMYGIPTNFSLYGIMIIGIGKIDGEELLLYRDCYGRYDEKKKDDGDGGPELRVIPVQYVKEGYQFPHILNLSIDYDWNNRKIFLKVKAGEKLTDPSIIEATFETNSEKINLIREKVGVYSYKIPRRYLGYDEPRFNFRVKKRYFWNNGNEWFEKSYLVR